MWVFYLTVCLYHMQAVPVGAKRGHQSLVLMGLVLMGLVLMGLVVMGLVLMGLVLQTVVSYRLGAGTGTQILWKKSHLSSTSNQQNAAE